MSMTGVNLASYFPFFLLRIDYQVISLVKSHGSKLKKSNVKSCLKFLRCLSIELSAPIYSPLG